MSSEDYEANGIGDEDDDENEELEEDTEDESEDHLSERIAERGGFRAWQRETPETSLDDRLKWFVCEDRLPMVEGAPRSSEFSCDVSIEGWLARLGTTYLASMSRYRKNFEAGQVPSLGYD